jgi:mono/diheme cytochrome c family protein
MMSRPRARAGASAAAVLLAAGIIGCGAGAGNGSGRPTSRVSGRSVFAADCAVCHSISGHSSPKQQGGDLRGLRLPRRELVQFTVEMPALHHALTPAQVQAVVAYVRSVEPRR